ncbi:unnamed protein product [Closterium sp. Naga37s-1]|nr:unnamed protein product [Closterium sp. Naga37s-1]
MASPNVLTFDTEGRAVDFDVWVDDLQLFLQCESKEGVSLFDHTSGVSAAPAASAGSTIRSQWTTRDAVARLAVRSHLPSAERAHFGQYKTAKSLYDAVVARYSSPATAALSRIMLPYLFPDLAAFHTVADLITHLRTSDARYRAALPSEFCAKTPPPMYITLFYLVTRLPDSLCSVRDYFLSLCPIELTVDLLEERLTAAEKSTVAVGASRGDPRAPFFEGCSPVPLLPSVASAAAVDLVGTEEVGAATAPSGRRRSGKGKGGKGGGGDGGAAVEAVEEAEGVAVEVGVVAGVGESVAAVEVVEAAAAAVEAAVAAVEVAAAVVLVEVEPRSVEALAVASASSSRVPVRPCHPSSFVSGTLGVGGLGVLVPALTFSAPACAMGRRADCHTLRSASGVAIFDLDFDAILAAMYAVTDSAEGDCYLCVPPDPGIEAAALGASESAAQGASESAAPGAGESALSGTAHAEALHTFTLDSGASHSFFRDSTTLTPLSRPVAVSLADPSGGPILAHSSTVLPCPAAPSGSLSGLHLPSFSTNLVSGADLQDVWVDQFTPGGQRVTHCTCTRTGRHLATFTRRPGSSLYTLTTESPPVAASSQVAASGQVFAAASRSGPESAPCSCQTLSHETLIWHHRLGHPSLPRLRGMASRTFVSGLPRSLPPLPPGPAPTCVPCVEGRQRAAPHSSEFPPTEAPMQTLHMDVWGPARIRGQGHERYFLLVVDDYSRYTTVFPLRRKGEVTEVLIDWIRAARHQLSECFGSDLPVLRLHSDTGGQFSSDLLRAFCRAEGIHQTFTLPASPQQNGIAERRIGMVMDVARTSMIQAAAPHFLWPFAVQYAAHQLNLQPRVSVLETTPTLRWTGKVGDASVFRIWGSRAFVRDSSADKLSFRAVPCVFLGFPPDAPGAPPVDPLPPQGPAPSGVSQVDPVEPVEVAVDSGAARGAEPAGAGPGGAKPGVVESEGAEPGGAEPEHAEPGGAESGGAAPGGAEPERAESGGPPGVLSRREPLSPQQLREWYARRCSRAAGAGGSTAGGATRAGAAGGPAGAVAAGGARTGGTGAARAGAAGGTVGAGAAGGAGVAGPGGAHTGGTGAAGVGAAGGTAGAGAAGGAGVAGPGGARTRGTGAAGAGAAGGTAGAGVAGAGGAAGVGAGGAGAVAAGGADGAGAAGGAGAGGAAGVGAGGAGAVAAGGAAGGAAGAADPGAGGTGAVSAGSGGAARPRPYFVPLLQQVLGLPPSTGPTPPLLCPPPDQSQSQLQPASLLPGPSPYSGPTRGLTERREPESRLASPVRTVRTGRVPRPRPPAVPGTHRMALRPSTAPQRVPLPSPPASSLPDVPDPPSDRARAASPTVTRLLATVVTDPSFESTAASALVAELVDFAAACRLDYAASLVAESESVCPPSVGGECALGTDVLEDRQEYFECFAAAVPHLVSMLVAPEGDPNAPDIPTPRSYAEAIEGPYSSQWQTAMDTQMASWKSTGTYVDEVPPPGSNIVSGMWIFRVKRPPGSPPVFKARYVARGFSQRQGVDFYQTFSPTPNMTTLRVLLHVAAQRVYELHSLDFSTAFLQGSLHEEIWLRRPPGFTGSFPAATQWSLRRPVYGLRQAPREWHDTLRTTLAALGFASSTADPSQFLRTDTSLPPFYILVCVDDLVFATADTEGLAHVKSELQKRHTCTDLGDLRSYLGLQITRDRAQRTITLTRSHMVQQVLQRFRFEYSSPQATPLPTGHSLSALPSDESVEPSGPYPELVGCLMYLMTCTRPDLAYPLSILARYVAPGRHRPEQWKAAKRVMRYLCSTSGMGFVLGGRA